MAAPHSGKEKNELTAPAPDNLTSRELTKSGSNPAVLRDFLEIAKHDFELRQKEIELQQQQAANEHEYIKLRLNARMAERPRR